jgi:alkylation response protein AidB-like acyl-CoA dehydrogenase
MEDTWHTVGMRSTGSNTWIAEDLFVPEYRTISTRAMSEGRVLPTSDEAMYRLPVMPLATLSLLGPLLGLGNAALRLAVDKAPTRPMSDTTYNRKSDSVGVQVQIADAALRLKTARLHAFHIADELDCCTATGQHIDYTARARMRAQCGHAAQQVLDAINLLVNVHGAESFALTSRMQQYWRDANIAARHAGLNTVVGYEIFGKALLGVNDTISPIL